MKVSELASARLLRFPIAPREICRRADLGMSKFAPWLLLPQLCIGVAVNLTFLVMLCVVNFGITTPGIVTGRHTTLGKGGTAFILEYSYKDGHHDRQRVDESNYYRFVPGAIVSLKYIDFCGHFVSLLGEPFSSKRSLLRPFWFYALILDAAMSVILWVVIVVPMRRKWLIQNGTATTGSVSRIIRRKAKGGRPCARVAYNYSIADGSSHSGTMPAAIGMASIIDEGQKVIVLYDPNKPKHSVAYEFAEYMAFDQEGVEVPNTIV